MLHFKEKLLSLVLFTSMLMIGACSDDKTKNENKDETEVTPPDGGGGDNQVEMSDLIISGVVRDENGTFLSNVEVSTGNQKTWTNDAGMFRFEQVAVYNERAVFNFKKNNYFSVVRTAQGKDGNMMDIVLHPKGNSDICVQTTFQASTSKVIQVADMKVDIPASGVIDDTTGEAYTGNVNINMLYLDPDDKRFAEMMPGSDLAAIRSDNSDAVLVSYGIVNVDMTGDQGQRLQIKENKTAKLTFPIPESLKNNLPSSIPLWHFNETTGLWVESGVATLQEDKYIGEVKHFSAINLDVPEKRVTIQGTVKDKAGKLLAHTKVSITGGFQTSVYTDNQGHYSVNIPTNAAVTVVVKSEEYGNYSSVIPYNIAAQPSGNKIITQDIILPVLYEITGQVVNTCSQSSAVSILLEYTLNGQLRQLSPKVTGVDGSFRISAPENYTGPAKLSICPFEGEAKEKELNLNNMDIVLGQIDVCMENTVGGELNGTDENGNHFFSQYVSTEAGEGVWIIDSNLLFWSMTDGNYMDFSIKNYMEEISEYNDIRFEYEHVTQGNRAWSFYGRLSASINKTGGSVLKTSFSGSGLFNSYNDQGNTLVANLTSAVFSFPIVLRGTIKKNVQKSSTLGFPSAGFDLPEPVDEAWIITNSKVYGKGGELYYKNRNINDFNEIVSQYTQKGFTTIESEGDDTSYKYIVLSKDDMIVMIDFDKDGTGTIYDDTGNSRDYKLVLTILKGYDKNLSIFSNTRSNNSFMTKWPKKRVNKNR